jgi:hypothetical protein
MQFKGNVSFSSREKNTTKQIIRHVKICSSIWNILRSAERLKNINKNNF